MLFFFNSSFSVRCYQQKITCVFFIFFLWRPPPPFAPFHPLAWMIGVDFGPYSPISFRQSMYLLRANKSIRPNPPVYPRCHQQPALLTKDEHFLQSNITRLLSPHQKYTDNSIMEEKRGAGDLRGAIARAIKRKVTWKKRKESPSFFAPPPPHFALSI